MRKDTTTFSDNNKLAVNLKFGDSIKILPKENLAPWAEGKFNNIEGMVNTNYLINGQDYRLLSRIMVNSLTSEIIFSKYRRSILNYFKNHLLSPDISPEEQSLVFGDNQQREKWAIDKSYFSGKLASIYARKDPSGKKTDFCIIPIRNISSGLKQGLLFIYENDNEIASQLIQSISPMNESDFYTASQKLLQYGLSLNRNDMSVIIEFGDGQWKK
ncbi:MAG: hypothetical protein IPP81_19220 [Chitinophagaceae bacterium]|nr:hypothetical protein [Chitinophagaceae bacterium]